MFGLFCGRTQGSQNDTADAKRKADGGTLARLKGFLGFWEGGSVAESGEGTTERATQRTNQHSKRRKGPSKKPSSNKKRKQKRSAGVPEKGRKTISVVEGVLHVLTQSHSETTAKVLSCPNEEDTTLNCLSEEEDFMDCLSEELQLKAEGDEELSSSCFATPLSSPQPSRPASHIFLVESEFELTSSVPSESGYNGSADDGRSTSSEQTDCKELQQQCCGGSSSTSDNEDDGSKEEDSHIKMISSLPLCFLNSFNDSGISVSESAMGTPLNTPGADCRCAPVFLETLGSSTAASMEASLPLLDPLPDDEDCVAPRMTADMELSQCMHMATWSDAIEEEQQADEEEEEEEEEDDLEIDDSMHSVSSYTPLQYTWSLYYDTLEGTNQQPKHHRHDYISHVHHVTTVTTVEEFWSVYNHILSPAELANSSNCHFFKSHIKPMWEDPVNKYGGKWVLTMKNQPEMLNQVWLEMLLTLIGDQFQKPGHICGAVASRRKKADKIALWTRSKRRTQNILVCKGIIQILFRVKQVPQSGKRQFLKGLAQGTGGMTLVFMHHNDALRSGSSYQNYAHIAVDECLEDLMKA